jgi:hypothetical protein
MKRVRWVAYVSWIGLATTGFACAGSTSSDGGGTGSSSGTASGSGGSSGGKVSTSSTSGSSSGSGSTSGSSSGSAGTSSTSGSGSGSGSTSGSSGSSSGSGDDGGSGDGQGPDPFACLTTPCAQGLTCCFYYDGNGNPVGGCVQSCPDGGTTVQCYAAKDCTTGTCCLSQTNDQPEASCQQSCGPDDVQYCDDNHPCPAGQTCDDTKGPFGLVCSTPTSRDGGHPTPDANTGD